jgi:hypothetical protein
MSKTSVMAMTTHSSQNPSKAHLKLTMTGIFGIPKATHSHSYVVSTAKFRTANLQREKERKKQTNKEGSIGSEVQQKSPDSYSSNTLKQQVSGN